MTRKPITFCADLTKRNLIIWDWVDCLVGKVLAAHLNLISRILIKNDPGVVPCNPRTGKTETLGSLGTQSIILGAFLASGTIVPENKCLKNGMQASSNTFTHAFICTHTNNTKRNMDE